MPVPCLLYPRECMIPHCIASKAVLLTATFMWLVLTPAHDSAAWDNTGDLRQVTPHRKTDDTILRVLSYNIHHAAGTDGKLDLTRIANVINSVKPDVVSLQEVDQNVRRSNSINQPDELAKLTGMRVLFAQNIPLQGGSYGNAILTRFEIRS